MHSEATAPRVIKGLGRKLDLEEGAPRAHLLEARALLSVALPASLREGTEHRGGGLGGELGPLGIADGAHETRLCPRLAVGSVACPRHLTRDELPYDDRERVHLTRLNVIVVKGFRCEIGERPAATAGGRALENRRAGACHGMRQRQEATRAPWAAVGTLSVWRAR